ncbi:MAG: hypothetical protein GY710_01065 [Desulfobacteraceae bacterium]|nr:hypothetical protein [Desulfobacteraceae bacterium]
MKKILFSLMLIFVFAVAGYAQGPNSLFVINFDNGTYKNGKLTLNGNGQSNVIYFSDDPEVEAGHMGIKKFVKIWGEGGQNFNSIPPNSTLSIIKDEVENNSVFILSNPQVDKAAIIFNVQLVKGKPNSTFGPGGLFINTKLGKKDL